MDEWKRQCLRENITYLKAEMNLLRSTMLDTLLAKVVLNEEEYDTIKVKETNQDQVQALVYGTLLRKGNRGFNVFCDVLKKEQEYIWKKLMKHRPSDSHLGDQQHDGGAKEPNLHFGHGNTAALLVAGAGISFEIFKKDVDRMVDLLKSSVGVSEGKIFMVTPTQTKETKESIQNTIDDVKKVMGDPNNGHLIFYYSGHFSKAKGFIVDDKKQDKTDYYLDMELAEELRKIPSKYVLFILDMCYSSCADVGAKDDDDVPLLWEYYTKSSWAKNGEGGDAYTAEKVVQWSSSGDEKSFTHERTQSSFFTDAIIDVITGPEAGKEIRREMSREQTHVTVLHLNEHVKQHVQKGLKQHGKVQTPVIRPTYADVDYFKTYPHFAKIV